MHTGLKSRWTGSVTRGRHQNCSRKTKGKCGFNSRCVVRKDGHSVNGSTAPRAHGEAGSRRNGIAQSGVRFPLGPPKIVTSKNGGRPIPIEGVEGWRRRRSRGWLGSCRNPRRSGGGSPQRPIDLSNVRAMKRPRRLMNFTSGRSDRIFFRDRAAICGSVRDVSRREISTSFSTWVGSIGAGPVPGLIRKLIVIPPQAR